MGPRFPGMLVTNPGAPPWTRIGRWYGWESGPITSKHYAHVTPMRGHFAWQKGWGPQGQQDSGGLGRGQGLEISEKLNVLDEMD